MPRNQQQMIADLINQQNNLPERISRDEIGQGKYFFIERCLTEDELEIVACVRAKRQSFFCLELKHLSVNPAFRKTGLGAAMIRIVEEFAKSENIPLVCATTCAKNAPAGNLFAKKGYAVVTQFTNPKTGNVCNIWQKVVTNV